MTWSLQRVVTAALVVAGVGLLGYRAATCMKAQRAEIHAAAAVSDPVAAVKMDAPLDPAKHKLDIEPAPWSGRKEPLGMAEFQGRTALVNFWATYCAPCRDEFPSLLALARRYEGRPFAVVTVSYDESWEEIAAFVKTFGKTPENLVFGRDPRGAHDEGTVKGRFGTELIPESYLVADGRIVAKFVNSRNWVHPDMLRFIDRYVKQRAN
jgi:thiol-disulfide isomerase/thioredoxin